MTAAFGQDVVLHARTVNGEDGDGNDAYDDDPRTLANVPVWPTGSTEDAQGKESLTDGLTALLPAGTAVTALDRVTVAGVAYEVNGNPTVHRSVLTGLEPGVLVTLTRVTG